MKFAAGLFMLLTASAISLFPPLKREPVLNEALPAANPPIRLVEGIHIEFAPGQPAGRHFHPVSVVGVVTGGSFRFQRAGGNEQILRQGDAFFEPAGTTIVHFDNVSVDHPASITAFYLTDSKDRATIQMLDKP